jgi:hypothetical protein
MMRAGVVRAERAISSIDNDTARADLPSSSLAGES